MSIALYVLRSLSTGNHYVGISKSPVRRLRQHNRNQSIGTRGKGPWERILEESYDTYAEARIREKHLKSGVGREWLRKQFEA